MKYDFNGKNINIPDADILRLQKSLNLSQEEAIETWLFDNDYTDDDVADELTAKAKENRITATVHKAKADAAPKQRKPRAKKENPEKANLIAKIAEFLPDLAENVRITNETKLIEFNIGENEYKLDLICKRKPKKA